MFLTWDPDAPGFWLTDDYFPALQKQDRMDRGGFGFSDTGISGFLPGHDRREVHEKAKT